MVPACVLKKSLRLSKSRTEHLSYRTHCFAGYLLAVRNKNKYCSSFNVQS